MKLIYFLSSDAIVRSFLRFLPGCLRRRDGGRIVPVDADVRSLKSLATLLEKRWEAYYFNTYVVFGKKRTACLLVDIDSLEGDVLSSVLDVLTTVTDGDVRDGVYVTGRGFHVYVAIRKLVDRRSLVLYAKRLLKGIKHVDHAHADAPNVRVPFSHVYAGDPRLVIPFQGSVEDSLRAQLNLNEVTHVPSKLPFLASSAVKEVEEIRHIEKQVTQEKTTRQTKTTETIAKVLPPCVLIAIKIANEEKNGNHLTHQQRVFLASFAKYVLGEEIGRDFIHAIMRLCLDYDERLTERYYDSMRLYTYSCSTLRSIGLCPFPSHKLCPFGGKLYRVFGVV